MAKVRLKDVAAVAGVSQGTASNVFNKPELVAEALRVQVLQAAERLGYQGPAPAARVLRSGKVGQVALLTDGSAEEFVSDIYAKRLMVGAARACDRAGIGLTLVGDAAKGQTGAGWSLETALADGFVLFCFEEQDEIFERASRRNLPLVRVDGSPRPGVPLVGIDNEGAAKMAMDALTTAGHRDLGILAMERRRAAAGGPIVGANQDGMGYGTTARRLEGYLRGAAEVGVAASAVPMFETLADEETVGEGIAYLMDRDTPPTAIAAMSDLIAMIAIRLLRARGLKVPDDVSIIGFDGVPEAAFTDPPLSTIAQPAEEKAEAAIEMLIGVRPMEDLALPTQLVMRGSIAPPRG